MSQAGALTSGGGGTIVSVSATQSVTNNDDGLFATTVAGAATVFLSNRDTNGISTIDDTPATALTFTPASGTGTYYVYGDVVAYNVDDTAGAAFSFSSAYLNNAGAVTEIAVEIGDSFKQAAMSTSSIDVSTDGTDIIVIVTGVAAKAINWSVFLNFRFVGT